MKKALLTALLALGAGVAMAQVEINIDLDDRGIEISPMLNGIFYEDINHSADGGLYAELIRNRSFEEFEFQRRRRRPGDEENDEPWREERQNNIQSWREVGECTLELTTEGLLNDKPLQVGVAAWRTKVTYKDPELIVDGEQVELPDITTWSSQQVTPPQRAGGPRRIRAFQLWSTDEEEGSVTSLGFGEGLKWMCPLEINSRKYSFRVKAKKNDGSEGFLLVFNYKNERDFDWMNVGGWGNTNNSIEQSVDGGRITLTEKEVKFKVKNDRWYDIRVDVDGDNMTAYVDGKLQFSAQHRNANMRGVFSNSTLDEATNTLNHPLNIIPRPANVDVEAEGKRLTFDVAPFSVSIITAKLK